VYNACQVCGRSPAAEVTVRRHVGMIVIGRRHRVRASLCREHGSKLLREWTLKTLVQGWWGGRSFYLNIYALIGNANASRALRQLPHATHGADHTGWEPEDDHAFGYAPAFGQPQPTYDAAPPVEPRPAFGSGGTFGSKSVFGTRPAQSDEDEFRQAG
jgi:hypothetical protein